jgi:hypothetical protein
MQRRQWWVPWRVRSSRRVSYDPQSHTFQQLKAFVSVKPTANCCTNCFVFSRIRQPSASSHLCLSVKLFFSSRTTARRSSSSVSSLVLYRYVLLMRMLSFSISLSQLLSRSSRFLSVYIAPTHVLVLSCLHISVIQLPSVFLQFC